MKDQHFATSTRVSRDFWLNGLEDLIPIEFRLLVKRELDEARQRSEEAIRIFGRPKRRKPRSYQHPSAAPKKPLCIRLQEVEALYKQGSKQDEIAKELEIRPSTVKGYLAELRRQGRIPPARGRSPNPLIREKQKKFLVCRDCGASMLTSDKKLSMRTTKEFGPLCQNCRHTKRKQGCKLHIIAADSVAASG